MRLLTKLTFLADEALEEVVSKKHDGEGRLGHFSRESRHGGSVIGVLMVLLEANGGIELESSRQGGHGKIDEKCAVVSHCGSCRMKLSWW